VAAAADALHRSRALAPGEFLPRGFPAGVAVPKHTLAISHRLIVGPGVELAPQPDFPVSRESCDLSSARLRVERRLTSTWLRWVRNTRHTDSARRLWYG
jgi:hypothetical protein